MNFINYKSLILFTCLISKLYRIPGGSFSKSFSNKSKPIIYFSRAASYCPSTKYIWPDNAISTALAN